MKLQVVVDKVTPRIEYAFEILLRTILKWEYELVLSEAIAAQPGCAYLCYAEHPLPDAAHIMPCGLLTETGIRKEAPITATMPELSGATSLFPSSAGQSDWVAGAFFLASDYEKYQQTHFDAHGRYEESAYPSASWGIWAYPLVHVYAWEIAALMERQYPQGVWARPSASPALVTMDVDFPWKYLRKPLWIQLGGAVKNLKEGNFMELKERTWTLLSRKDPYYTFPFLQTLLPKDRTRTFFLLERGHEHDSRFTWENQKYRQLIRQWQAAGYTCGIHPSYLSSEKEGQITAERAYLVEILGENVPLSRQHFLKYRLPQTFRELLAAGVSEDYSLGTISRPGFRCGMAVPFRWYDLEREITTDLTLVPCQVMDRTLLSYLHLNPEQAMFLLGKIHTTTRQWGGQFVLLLHNDAFSGSEPWEGWRGPIVEMVKRVLEA